MEYYFALPVKGRVARSRLDSDCASCCTASRSETIHHFANKVFQRCFLICANNDLAVDAPLVDVTDALLD